MNPALLGYQRRRRLSNRGLLTAIKHGRMASAYEHTRASDATYRDAGDVIRTAAADELRQGHHVLNRNTGLYERAVLTEGGRTNRCLNYAFVDSNGDGLADHWTAEALASFSVTDGEQTATASAQFGAIRQEIDFGSATGPWTFKAELKGEYARLTCYLYDAAKTFLGSATTTPTTDPVNFTRHEVTSSRTDVRYVRIRCEDGRTSGWTPMTMRRPQVEVAPFASSDITTPDAVVSRAADNLSLPFRHVPQAMTAYARFFEGGSIDLATFPTLFWIGSTSAANNLRVIVGGAGYTVDFRDNAGTSLTSSTGAGAVDIGDLVEFRAVLHEDGSVQAALTKNEGVELVGVRSAPGALGAAWDSPKLQVGQRSNGAHGFNAFTDLRLDPGALSLDECRRLAGVRA